MERSTLLIGILGIGSLAATMAVATSNQPAVPPWGVDLSFVDKTVKPGDDFFMYANGTWYKHNTIPADRSYSGVNLELNLQNEARLKGHRRRSAHAQNSQRRRDEAA